jgi:glycerol-3-phosphate acyltransferase PlsY
MTNVVRTVGVPVGALVLLLDMGKGVGAVALARYVLEAPEAAQAAAALSAIAGHNWPVFIGFRGGRGTATGWGALLMLWPVAGLVATIVGLLLIAITRYVSLGSVTATLVGCAVLAVACLAGAAPMGLLWFAAIGCAFVVGRHRGNIERLLKGEERKLGQSV